MTYKNNRFIFSQLMLFSSSKDIAIHAQDCSSTEGDDIHSTVGYLRKLRTKYFLAYQQEHHART